MVWRGINTAVTSMTLGEQLNKMARMQCRPVFSPGARCRSALYTVDVGGNSGKGGGGGNINSGALCTHTRCFTIHFWHMYLYVWSKHFVHNAQKVVQLCKSAKLKFHLYTSFGSKLSGPYIIKKLKVSPVGTGHAKFSKSEAEDRPPVMR